MGQYWSAITVSTKASALKEFLIAGGVPGAVLMNAVAADTEYNHLMKECPIVSVFYGHNGRIPAGTKQVNDGQDERIRIAFNE